MLSRGFGLVRGCTVAGSLEFRRSVHNSAKEGFTDASYYAQSRPGYPEEMVAEMKVKHHTSTIIAILAITTA
jgi:hypothetical protein